MVITTKQHIKNCPEWWLESPRSNIFDLFDPHNLAKKGVWQQMAITMKSEIKNCVGIHDPMPKTLSDDPKTAIFRVFVIFLTEAGEGP